MQATPALTRTGENTLEQALRHAEWLASDDPHYWVIGGAYIYEQTLHRANELHITHVHDTPPGDTWFPRFDPRDWYIDEAARGDGWTRCVYSKERA